MTSEESWRACYRLPEMGEAYAPRVEPPVELLWSVKLPEQPASAMTFAGGEAFASGRQDVYSVQRSGVTGMGLALSRRGVGPSSPSSFFNRVSSVGRGKLHVWDLTTREVDVFDGSPYFLGAWHSEQGPIAEFSTGTYLLSTRSFHERSSTLGGAVSNGCLFGLRRTDHDERGCLRLDSNEFEWRYDGLVGATWVGQEALVGVVAVPGQGARAHWIERATGVCLRDDLPGVWARRNLTVQGNYAVASGIMFRFPSGEVIGRLEDCWAAMLSGDLVWYFECSVKRTGKQMFALVCYDPGQRREVWRESLSTHSNREFHVGFSEGRMFRAVGKVVECYGTP